MLKEQLSSVQQQGSKSQEGLKKKEKEVEKLQAQFKAAQGSFDEEVKKMKEQVAKLQKVNSEKVSKKSNITHQFSPQIYLTSLLRVQYQQGEEEKKLNIQMSVLEQNLGSEKSRVSDLQKSLEQSKETLNKLQSDFYGKESEVSALRQDLKVWQTNDGVSFMRLC